MTHIDIRRPLTIFLLALLLFNLANWLMPLTDPVEAIYGQVAKEMVERGDYVVPRFLGRPFYEKPPFMYWSIALSYRLFGINDWAARFPGTLFAAFGLALLFVVAGKVFSPRAAWLSCLVMAGTLQYAVLGRMVLTDLYLLFFLSACLSCFFLGWQAGEKGHWLVRAAYALAGLAVLAKGPLGLALPGLVGVVYLIATRGWRRWRDLCLPSGLLIFAAVALPWYILIWQRQGSAFLLTFLGVHNYLRAVKAQAPELNRWWYYLAMLPVGFLPWSGFLPYGFASGWPHARERTGGFFFLLWVLVIFVFFNLVATKYPTYLLPAFFPMSALIGAFLAGCWDKGLKMNRTALALWHLPVMAALILLPVAAFVTLRRLYPLNAAGAAVVPFALLCLLGFTGILWGIVRSRIKVLVVSLGLVGLLQAPLLMGTLVGAHSEMFSTKKALARMQELGWRGEPIGIIGKYRWSAAYYSGQKAPSLTEAAPPNPAELSWQTKLVMPFAKPQAFLNQPGRFYLLGDPKALAGMNASLRGRVERIGGVGPVTLFRSKNGEAGEEPAE